MGAGEKLRFSNNLGVPAALEKALYNNSSQSVAKVELSWI